MTTAAVTGAQSELGCRVLLALRARGHDVVAVDRGRPDVAVPFRPANADGSVRPHAFEGADVVVHVLHAEAPGHDPAAGAQLDVESARSVLAEAERAGVRAVVHVSSALAYGALADNPVPLTEDAPLRAGPEFPYAWHRRLAEELVAQWAAAHPGTRVVVLRPVTVFGDGQDDFVARHLESPRLPLVRGHLPPMQALDLDDLVAAIVPGAEGELRGAYNVAPEGWLTAEQVCAILRRKPVRLPESLAYPLAARLWSSHLAAAPAGSLAYLMHPWVVDARRLCAAGWAPARTNREVLEAFAAQHHSRLTIGPVRTTRATVAAAGLTAGALAGLAVRRLRRA
jgi:nucleoside-diphosphate-sugar epimerase